MCLLQPKTNHIFPVMKKKRIEKFFRLLLLQNTWKCAQLIGRGEVNALLKKNDS